MAFEANLPSLQFTNSPNAPGSNGFTPIHDAAHNGHLDVVKFLVELTDSTPNALNNMGETPVDVAKQEGHNEIVKFLEDYIKKAEQIQKHKRMRNLKLKNRRQKTKNHVQQSLNCTTLFYLLPIYILYKIVILILSYVWQTKQLLYSLFWFLIFKENIL